MAVGSTGPLAFGLNQGSHLRFSSKTSSKEPYNLWSYDAHTDDNDNNEGFAYLP